MIQLILQAAAGILTFFALGALLKGRWEEAQAIGVLAIVLLFASTLPA